MERLEKKGEHAEQPSLGMFFDVTRKTIGYKTECLIDAGAKWRLRTLDNRQSTKFDPIIKNLEAESTELKESKDKIEAVFKTLFSGFTGKGDDLLQAFCQQTYQYYDTDGLCFISDFAVEIADIEGLKKIQDAYFNVVFDREMADWNRIWAGTSQNIPDLHAFKKWQEQRESKVVLVSFDPYLNLSNMDKEGKRYLNENDAFTIILVADEDIGKNKFDLDTEIKDLKQMFLMVVRRKLREAKMQKEVIREQKKLFTTMMSSIMHRFKSYTSHQAERIAIDNMRQSFERVLITEDYSAFDKEFHSIRDVSEYFLSPFINEQLGKKLNKIADKELKYKFETACKQYLGKLKFLKKTEDIDVKELEIKFNENYLPRIQVKLREEFVKEAVKILINNAVEHSAIYAQETKNKAEIIMSFNLSPQLENDLYLLEFSIINSSFPIPYQRLKVINSPDPQQAQKDALKASSTGIGIFIARTQLQKSAGKRADIRLDNVGENYVEAKLTLPARKVILHDDKLEEKHEIFSESDFVEFNYILYIEDTFKYRENSRKALLKLVSDENKLFVCDNRQEAISIIRNVLPSIVLLDLITLRKPNDYDPMAEYGIDVIEEILKNNSKIPIVILSHLQAKEIEDFLMGLNLMDYQVKIKEFDQEDIEDVEIEEKTIVIPSHDTKDLLNDEEGKVLMKALETWVKKHMPSYIRPGPSNNGGIEIQEKNELRFLEVKLNDKDFEKKLEDYRINNISDVSPDEIFIATSRVNNEDTLFETISRWFSHPGLKSFYEDKQDSDRLYPLTRNASIRTIFLDIKIADKLKELIDIKFKYWCLLHNILISDPKIELDSALAWKWKFTAHGTRGTLSKMRHDIKNKISVDEGKEIIAKINEMEEQLLFNEEKLNSELKNAFKNKDKTIIKTLKDRPDKFNLNPKDLFKELHSDFSRHKSPEQIQEFNVTLENLREFLEK
jgi:hypothetical protein